MFVFVFVSKTIDQSSKFRMESEQECGYNFRLTNNARPQNTYNLRPQRQSRQLQAFMSLSELCLQAPSLHRHPVQLPIQTLLFCFDFLQLLFLLVLCRLVLLLLLFLLFTVTIRAVLSTVVSGFAVAVELGTEGIAHSELINRVAQKPTPKAARLLLSLEVAPERGPADAAPHGLAIEGAAVVR